MAEQPGKFKEEHFVSKVVKDPKQPPDTLLLRGYVGESSEEEYTRLYFDAQLSVYVEIPNTAILHIQEIPVEQSILGESYVWIQKDAELVQGKVGPNRVKAKFLEGPIVQEFMRGTQFGGTGIGQPMLQFGGPVPQPEGQPTRFGCASRMNIPCPPSVNIPCAPKISVNIPCLSVNKPCLSVMPCLPSVDKPCLSVNIPCPQLPQGGWGISEACMPGQEGPAWQGDTGQFGGAGIGQRMLQFGGPAPQPELQASVGYCPSVNSPCVPISQKFPCPIHSVNVPCLPPISRNIPCPSVNRPCPQQPQGAWGVSQACMPEYEGPIWQGGVGQFGGAGMG